MCPSSLSRVQGRWLGRYAGLVSKTARYETTGFENLTAASAGGPCIMAAWHGLTMMVTGFIRARLDASRFVLLVPDDPRGVVLDAWARSWGAESFAVSMHEESLVAARRLLSLIRKLRPREIQQAREHGSPAKNLYVNPDGPDGPSHVPKDGVFFIARKANAPIVPVGAYTAAALHIPRWDRYTIPLPTSHIALVFGEPFVVPPSGSVEPARSELTARLNLVERRAEELYGAARK